MICMSAQISCILPGLLVPSLKHVTSNYEAFLVFVECSLTCILPSFVTPMIKMLWHREVQRWSKWGPVRCDPWCTRIHIFSIPLALAYSISDHLCFQSKYEAIFSLDRISFLKFVSKMTTFGRWLDGSTLHLQGGVSEPCCVNIYVVFIPRCSLTPSLKQFHMRPCLLFFLSAF